ncbi:MAG: PhnD/SsuA/transferrin family substrate-binding protein [Methyloprofundus sp.]|nr:PhnD/SsuA/transferrin family substrate-binding protein [Methyloprofundus sp.]
MSYQFTVSPDFTPAQLSGWYIFNTWLQNQTDNAIHLEMYNDFHSQRKAIEEDRVDLIYANPFDATMLVRDKGFRPLVKPAAMSDEVIIAVSATNLVEDVEYLEAGIKLAVTDAPDVQMMGMIMLESGDLDSSNVELITCDANILVAKQILREEAEVGIFLASAYDELSSMIKDELRILVRSQISVIHHSLMIGPNLLDQREKIHDILLNMSHDEKGQGVLESLGFQQWETVSEDEMEFMIDLMDTLMM